MDIIKTLKESKSQDYSSFISIMEQVEDKSKEEMKMKARYQTVYDSNKGEQVAVMKNEATFQEAEQLGKIYCSLLNLKYIRTELVIINEEEI